MKDTRKIEWALSVLSEQGTVQDIIDTDDGKYWDEWFCGDSLVEVALTVDGERRKRAGKMKQLLEKSKRKGDMTREYRVSVMGNEFVVIRRNPATGEEEAIAVENSMQKATDAIEKDAYGETANE